MSCYLFKIVQKTTGLGISCYGIFCGLIIQNIGLLQNTKSQGRNYIIMPLEAPLMSKAARFGLNLADLGPILLKKINNGALDAVDKVDLYLRHHFGLRRMHLR